MTLFRKLTDEEQEKLGLSNIDVLLSTRASESTLLNLLQQVSKDSTLDELGITLEDIKSGITFQNDEQSSSNSSVKLNQYTQIDLLNLIYEELKLQTKLLKKIYQ